MQKDREATKTKMGIIAVLGTQRLQYPLIREYSLNHIRDPTITYGIFLNFLTDPFKKIPWRNPLKNTRFKVYSLIKGYWSLWGFRAISDLKSKSRAPVLQKIGALCWGPLTIVGSLV